jgi:hypothetical protein
MTRGLQRYVELLDELLWRRAIGNPDDETEAFFAVALNDCRAEMTRDEEARVEGIVAQRIGVSARPSLGLVDTNPPATDDSPLRTAA